MGTQQILLIVLSVIIVGVAIAVGITMFRNQAYNSNAQGLAAEATNMRTEVVQFFKTPLDQGGGGGLPVAATITACETKMGINTTTHKISKPNIGEFQLKLTANSEVAKIGALGVEKKGLNYPTFIVTFDLVSGDVAADGAVTGTGTAIPSLD